MSLKSVKTLTAAQIAKKWKLSHKTVTSLIDDGAKVEHEHDKSMKNAKEIARDHISERPDYYKKLRKMEKSKVSMKEGISAGPEREVDHTIGDLTGSSRKVMKVDEVKLPKVPEKVKSKSKKAIAVGMTAANIATGADIYDRASRGVGSPIRDVAAAASGLPGKVGYAAMGANYTVKGFDKAREHIKARQKQMEEQGSPANPARYTERPMYETKRVRFIGKQNPADLPPRPADYKPGDFGSKLAHEGGIKYPGKKKPSRPIKEDQIDEISAELVGKVSNARFWRKEAPSKTLTRAINKKFIESGKKKEEPKKPLKEGSVQLGPLRTHSFTYKDASGKDKESGAPESPGDVKKFHSGSYGERKVPGGKETEYVGRDMESTTTKPDTGDGAGWSGYVKSKTDVETSSTRSKTTTEPEKKEPWSRTGNEKLSDLVSEKTTMDTKELINEALDDILENNLVSMKENLMTALQEKAMEKIEEKKKEIAANYFAQ